MDVKEINNVINSAALGRVPAQNGAAVMGQFAGLIAQGSDLSSELLASRQNENSGVAVERRAPISKENAFDGRRAGDKADKSRKESEKTSAPERKTREKRRQTSSPQNEDAVPQSQNVSADNASRPVEKMSDDGSEMQGVVAVNAENSVEGGVVENVNEAVSAEDSVMPLSAFVGDNLPSANIDAAATVEVQKGAENGVNLSAAELSGAIALPENMLESAENADLGDVVRIEEIKTGEALTEDKNLLAQTAEKIVKTENQDEFAVKENKELRAQSAELAEMLDEGQKLNVKVDVKEEKISYLSGKDLVKDRLALNEVLTAETDGSENISTMAPETQSAPAANSHQSAPVTAFTPIAISNENNTFAVASNAVENVSSSADSQVVSAGAVSGGLAGNENSGRTSDVSFRDVYKGMSKEVVEQVKVNITKSAVKGVDTINVRLKPEDLGHIEIKMQIKDGKLQAHIISSRPETAEILQKESAALEKAFNDAGFQTDDNSLNFSFREENQANQNKGGNSELRNFMGEIFENETEGELMSVASEYGWNDSRGLNIRV